MNIFLLLKTIEMSLFKLDLPISKEYVSYVNELLQLTISRFIAFLVYKSSSMKKNFMDISFMELYIYLFIGCSFYHLLIKDLIEIV